MVAPLRLAFPLVLTFTGLLFAGDGYNVGVEDKDVSVKTTDKPSRLPRVRLGGVMIGAGYSHFSGSRLGYGYGPGYGWPYGYDPFLYGYGFHPGFFTGFGYGPSLGEIKLKSDDPNAWVYLDGALAGKAEKLKRMWLEPGVYDLELRSGNRRFGQKVYVLSGKTLRLTADPVRFEVRP